jgi:hypothetical protein
MSLDVWQHWVDGQLVETLAPLPGDLPTDERVLKEREYRFGWDDATGLVGITLIGVANGLKVVVAAGTELFYRVDPASYALPRYRPDAPFEELPLAQNPLSQQMATFLSERHRGSKPKREHAGMWSFVMPWPIIPPRSLTPTSTLRRIAEEAVRASRSAVGKRGR